MFEAAVTAYRATLRSSMQGGDTPLCETTRTRLAQADELLDWSGIRLAPLSIRRTRGAACTTRAGSQPATPTARFCAIRTCRYGLMVARLRCDRFSSRKVSTWSWLRASFPKRPSDLASIVPPKSCTTGPLQHQATTGASPGSGRPKTASVHGSCGLCLALSLKPTTLTMVDRTNARLRYANDRSGSGGYPIFLSRQANNLFAPLPARQAGQHRPDCAGDGGVDRLSARSVNLIVVLPFKSHKYSEVVRELRTKFVQPRDVVPQQLEVRQVSCVGRWEGFSDWVARWLSNAFLHTSSHVVQSSATTNERCQISSQAIRQIVNSCLYSLCTREERMTALPKQKLER